ncbi:MAG: AI-2E family transporter [Bdellovibrionales bacterium]|nr:AI-2E family transporter [Bdellovibrionales bacterium]
MAPNNQNYRENLLIPYCLLFLAAVAAAGTLIYTRVVLLPLLFSVFFFALTSPAVKFLQNKVAFPRWVAVATVFFIVCLLSAGFIFVVVASIEDFVQGADVYRLRVLNFFESSLEWASHFGFSVDKRSAIEQLKSLPLFSFLRSLTGGLTSLFANAFLVLIFLLFLLAGENKDHQSHPILDEILNKMSHYLVIKSLLSFATGFCVGVILIAFDVELAILLGLLTFLLNFVPNVGSLISTILPLPLVLVEYGWGGRFFGVLGLSLLVQLVIGNYLEPKLLGESMDLHPVTILVFLMFWGLIWGVAGMFLAVPITAVLKIILDRFTTTKALAELLGGRF